MEPDAEWWPSLLEFPSVPPVISEAATPPVWALNIVFGLSGLFWTTAYLMCIRRARIEKVISAPWLSVGTNITWNFVYAFVFHLQAVQDVVSLVYFLVEVVLLVQVFQYGYKDSRLSRPSFNWMIVAMLVFGLAAHIAAAWDFADRGGYTGFATTLLTSLAFVLLINQRQSTAGTTMYIAITKMIGTGAAAAGFALLYPTRMLLWVFWITMILLDLYYIALVHRQFKAEGVSPWRKV